MRTILVRVTAAHIAGAASAGYGPRIIMAALTDLLVPGVFIAIDTCWVMFAHRGARHYVHLPLHILPYTIDGRRTPLLSPIAFKLGVPTAIVKPRPRPRRRHDS